MTRRRHGPLKDRRGVDLTQGLFWETRHSEYQPSYSTKPEDYEVDGVVYPSLKRIYMECMDPTEEQFVQKAFDGNWLQWDKIRNSSQLAQFFKRSVKIQPEVPWYSEWRDELEVKLRSLGVRAIVKIAESEGGASFSAAKFLASGEWKGRRGRPTKGEVERERRIAAGIEAEVEDDLERMRKAKARKKAL